MHNKYLKQRAYLRKMADRMSRDSHYGQKMSRGFIGYETMRPSHDYAHSNKDYRDYKDYEDYKRMKDYKDYKEYKDYRDSKRGRDSKDYEDERMKDYESDYSYSYEDGAMEEDYKKDLHKWAEKLKSKDKFNMPKEQVISHAKSLGIRFHEFNEDEFYTTYLMMVSDYKELGSDPSFFIRMARDFLEDDDMAVTPSEKLCIYMYKIAMGE